LECIAAYRLKDQTANLRSKIFKAWQRLSGEREIMLCTIGQLYLYEPAKRIAFKRWVRKMRKVRLQRQKREARRACERDLRARETESIQKISALQSELDAVKQLLVEHEQQHGDMQEKLRRAFMRGVVGLNLEAMDVFGEVPTSESLRRGRGDGIDQRRDEDGEDFVVEPVPRIAVMRHR
jgi:hypothetical protein